MARRGRRKIKVGPNQVNFGAVAGGEGMVPAPPPESAPRRAVVTVERPYVDRGHGMFIEMVDNPERGQREMKLEFCRTCGRETPHVYTCVQRRGPRVWEFYCARHSAGEVLL